MSHVDPGPLASYGILSDPNLTSYFSNSRMRKHLIKAGLVTRRGEIVSEKVFRLNNARKEHQRHVRDLLAQAIVHKALDMERHRQMMIKKQLEEIGKQERVKRIRADRALRGDEDILPLLSPKPNKHVRRKKRQLYNAPSTSVQLKHASTAFDAGYNGNQYQERREYPSSAGDAPYNTRATRVQAAYPIVEIDNQHLHQLDQQALHSFSLNLPNNDQGTGVGSGHTFDTTSKEITPAPKASKRKVKVKKSNSSRGLALMQRESISNKRSIELHRREPPMIYRRQLRSLCIITFKYLGKMVNLDAETEDPRDEVAVYQQHCGGENLCVYNGKLLPGNNFTMVSQRHRGYPFSLTFYLNGMIAERLSACCEYKHKLGHKLGAKTSHFGFIKVEGAHPCYKCVVAEAQKSSKPKQKRVNKNPNPAPIRKPRVNRQNEPPKDKEDDYSSSESSSTVSSLSSITDSEDEIKEIEESLKDVTVEDKPEENLSVIPESKAEELDKTPIEIPTHTSTTEPMKEQEQGNQSSEHTTDHDSSHSSSSSSSESSDSESDAPTDTQPLSIAEFLQDKSNITLSNICLTQNHITEISSFLTEAETQLSLNSVVLLNCGLTDKILKELTNFLVSCKNIKTLNLGKNNISSACIDPLVKLMQETDLENLYLDENPLTDRDVQLFLRDLNTLFYEDHEERDGHVPSLLLLSVNYIKIEYAGMNAISDFLSLNPPLHTLNAKGCSLSGDTMPSLWNVLSSGQNLNLKVLSLASNQLNDHSIEQFCGTMSHNSCLERVDLTDNGITEDGAKHLLEFVQNNAKIRHLQLSRGNKIKHKTLRQIREFILAKAT